MQCSKPSRDSIGPWEGLILCPRQPFSDPASIFNTWPQQKEESMWRTRCGRLYGLGMEGVIISVTFHCPELGHMATSSSKAGSCRLAVCPAKGLGEHLASLCHANWSVPFKPSHLKSHKCVHGYMSNGEESGRIHTKFLPLMSKKETFTLICLYYIFFNDGL